MKEGSDIQIGELLVEIKVQARAVRAINESLIQLADKVAGSQGKRGVLLLLQTGITSERVEKEWQRFKRIFRPDLLERLSIYIYNGTGFYGIPKDPSEKESNLLIDVIEKENKAGNNFILLRSPDRFYDVLRFLIFHWMQRTGPLSPTWVAEQIGCSYPTVADATERLGDYIHRHTDRKIELKAFPREAWQRLVVNAQDVRQTRAFSFTEGTGRSVDSLLNRMHRYSFKNVAVGGTQGARFHFRDIDIVGNPRLDLTVLCSENSLDISFLKRLDPSLIPVEKNQKPAVVLHMAFWKNPIYEFKVDGFTFTDPVECLLDLHEMRFDGQVDEIIRQLPFKDDEHHDDHDNEEDDG